jgi:antitoxin component of RelBE/YafQ-DinJ toxin-antitoxin module
MAVEKKQNRVIRVPDTLWSAARKRADERGETVSEAVRKFLERYVR